MWKYVQVKLSVATLFYLYFVWHKKYKKLSTIVFVCHCLLLSFCYTLFFFTNSIQMLLISVEQEHFSPNRLSHVLLLLK